MVDFNVSVQELAKARCELNVMSNDRSLLMEAWQAENSEFLERYDKAKGALKVAEEALRESVVKHYKTTEDKKPHAALGIRITKKIEYDPDTARKWAVENAPGFLALDKKRFEKARRDEMVPDMPGEVVEVPSATIKTILTEWLITESALSEANAPELPEVE